MKEPSIQIIDNEIWTCYNSFTKQKGEDNDIDKGYKLNRAREGARQYY